MWCLHYRQHQPARTGVVPLWDTYRMPPSQLGTSTTPCPAPISCLTPPRHWAQQKVLEISIAETLREVPPTSRLRHINRQHEELCPAGAYVLGPDDNKRSPSPLLVHLPHSISTKKSCPFFFFKCISSRYLLNYVLKCNIWGVICRWEGEESSLFYFVHVLTGV